MADTVGRGVIELSADSSRLRASINEARATLRGFGKDVSDSIGSAGDRAAKSIDRYVQGLQQQAVAQTRSRREAELYGLALRGASEAQLGAANQALRLAEANERGREIGESLRTGLLRLGIAAAAAAGGLAVLYQRSIDGIANYQQLGERIGESAVAIASLQTASDVSGVSLERVASFSVRLTKALSETDDESKKVGKALAALGINFDAFKAKSPVERVEALSKALAGFQGGAEKTAVLEALVRGSSDLIPLLNDLAEGSQRFTRLTEEQIQAADQAAKAHARQVSELKQLGQQIAVAALPSVTDLIGALKDVIVQTTGAADAAGTLASKAGGVQDFADSSARFLAGLIDVTRKVASGFQYVGETIGATAAIAGAVVRGEFSLIPKIIADAREQGQKYLAETTSAVDALDRRIAARGSQSGQEASSAPKPKIDISGLNRDKVKKDLSAIAEARAQLTYDVDLIRKQSAAIVDIFSNDEKILEAKRAAGLLSESDYWRQKREFIQINASEQERALQAEIARLERERSSRALSGKDRIDLDRKIEDASSKLQKVQRDAATEIDVLGIREKAALTKIEQGFRDAEAAAQDFLDSLRRTQDRDLAGIGAGNRERDRAAGRAQIEDRFDQQRRDLEKQRRDAEFAGTFNADARRRYDDELDRIRRFQSKALEEWDDYYARRLAKEQDLSNGISESLRNYVAEAENGAKAMERIFDRSLGGIEDAFVDLATKGKADFRGLVDSIVADIIRMTVRAQIAGILKAGGADSASGFDFGSLIGLAASFFGGGSSGIVAGDSAYSATSAAIMGRRALGGPVSRGGLYQVNENGAGELLNVRGKQYLIPGADGSVKPSAGSGGKSVSNTFNFVLQQPANKATQEQIAAAALRGLRQGERNS